MRRLVLGGTMLILAFTLNCRRQQSNETGGVGDTADTAAAAPIPETPEPPATRDFSFDQRQDFVQSVRQQLAEIDRDIEELASQAKSRGGAVSDRALANIRASRRAVNQNLQRIETATAANWEQRKTGVTRAVDNLNESIEGARPK
jgi:small-conductance mechanosensitive channel